ncbi:hypothetical protein Ami103574_15600 [Aminipila butyrica]|uniref:Uncharacterized protein n=1 Tax=Aminipila butyrica TaxID=433296 RepID=A0A858BX23_9FIRM|nr:hypothetical protein [Aminipila butyrica]QIB70631.1 hypothetical protein Ami103574_15600 [Aminipila butyrica]
MENMKSQNSIILNQQNGLLEVGKALVPYMKRGSSYIVYDEGYLQDNDVILYVHTKASKAAATCRILWNKFNIKENIIYENPIAFLGIFGRNDSQIIMVNEKKIDIDTILCGRQIQVQASKNHAKITLDQETLKDNDCNGKLMIIDESRIKFLSSENLAGILEGERFPASIFFGENQISA